MRIKLEPKSNYLPLQTKYSSSPLTYSSKVYPRSYESQIPSATSIDRKFDTKGAQIPIRTENSTYITESKQMNRNCIHSFMYSDL